jgi:hypothetical protein
MNAGVSMQKWQPLGFLALALFCLLAVGCGGGGGAGTPEEERQLGSQVSMLADMADKYDTFKEQFAAGAAPPEAEMKKYGELQFAGDPPKITGDTATIPITVIKQGQILGKVEWTAVKEGDKWKIKTAPLP